MAPRRKAPRRRNAKVFSISAIEGGAALSLLSSTNAGNAVQQALKGDIAGGINTLSNSIQSNKSRIMGTIAATAAAKVLAKSFRIGRIAKLGPVAVRG